MKRRITASDCYKIAFLFLDEQWKSNQLEHLAITLGSMAIIDYSLSMSTDNVMDSAMWNIWRRVFDKCSDEDGCVSEVQGYKVMAEYLKGLTSKGISGEGLMGYQENFEYAQKILPNEYLKAGLIKDHPYWKGWDCWIRAVCDGETV